jgi:pimeloyl-ACP methyl ester carboxylesterase
VSVRALSTAAVLAAALLLGAASGASAKTTWLCKPGLKHDPCTPSLKTTRIDAAGTAQGTFTPSTLKRRPVDCFYVYPTVSDQTTPIADKRIDPEERSIALYQAARYSSLCRVYAPMYRQVTLAALNGATTVTQAQRNIGYRDVRAAWRDYLKHFNHGRGVILIGHSQGTFVLRRLVAKEIDRKPSARRRLVSAVLLGGDVLVKAGSDRGGDFEHIRACRSRNQLGCVIAFSTFNAPPPANSLFGRAPAGEQVLCTNPAALGGGAAKLDTVLPSAPFAPASTLGKITPGIGYAPFHVSTAWVESDGVYTAQCSDADGASVLQISGSPVLHALPDATWGLHLVDANIALGNLVKDVTHQAIRYVAKHR